jgi:hypothetical protein
MLMSSSVPNVFGNFDDAESDGEDGCDKFIKGESNPRMLSLKIKSTKIEDSDQNHPVKKVKTEHSKNLISITTSSDPWLCEGIVVKVKTGSSDFVNKKGVVHSITPDKYGAEVDLLKDEPLCRRVIFDQEDLETVIPQPGRLVKIVRPAELRGEVATLLEILKNGVRVELLKSKEVKELGFDDVSRLFDGR